MSIISWNEFSENSHIEPSQSMSTTYLDVTRDLVASLGETRPTVAPVPSTGTASP